MQAEALQGAVFEWEGKKQAPGCRAWGSTAELCTGPQSSRSGQTAAAGATPLKSHNHNLYNSQGKQHPT